MTCLPEGFIGFLLVTLFILGCIVGAKAKS